MAIKKDTLDQLLDGRDPKEVFNKDGLFDELKKALAERVLNAELDDHLESEAPAGRRNHRNGHSKKTVLTETAKLDIRIPRDREGTFDPKLIARYQRRFPGFDEKIVSMYARGMTTREIQGHLMELYGLEVSPDLISTVTDAPWRNGRTVRWRRVTRSSSSTQCGSRFETRAWSATRRSTSPWASRQTARRIFSACGSRGGARRFRCGPLGAKISRHRAGLAAQLGQSHSLLRLPGGGAPDHLHDERH